ncbi:MAG TPA: VWA domain-containing protein [Actinomycetes bacterium]|jgi:hypothetical protein|nr:VWA domain-containing protein [Actinomycetes bacterium]
MSSDADRRSPAVLLRGVDRAAFAVSLAVRLRQRGVPVGLTGIEAFTRALDVSAPGTVASLYWTARVALVRRRSELPAFDDVFDAVFRHATFEVDPVAREGAGPVPLPSDRNVAVPNGKGDPVLGEGLPWATLPPAVTAGTDDEAGDLDLPTRWASDLEAVADLPFEQLGAAELGELGRWLEDALRHWPTRRSRRRAPHPSGGQVALRPTIARARRTGWEPVELVRVAPVPRPRKVVMLCDVSQSMQPQVPAYFHLMRALATVAGGETFAFATTLTRLTPVLRHRSAEVAVRLATERVTDRFGGTRIATAVTEVLASHHGSAVRGGIVVLASDGWDSGPPEELARAMARLRRHAHRVVWLNPRAGAPGFAPLVGTMAAALPYCDTLLPADDVRSMAAVVAELCRPDRGRAVVRGV